MHKSVYSIVLSDEVVAAVDRLAARSGTSRSALIERLLAQAVSFQTPEMRIREIFAQAERLLTEGDAFRPMLQASDSMMSLRAPLSYKYNPTVRYSVELSREGGGSHGKLRVSLRSQSSALVRVLGEFFRLWDGVERAYTGGAPCALGEGKYVRALRLPEGSDDEAGACIAAYIRAFDEGMNAFFARLDDPQEAAAAVERVYRRYAQDGVIL